MNGEKKNIGRGHWLVARISEQISIKLVELLDNQYNI